MKKEYICDYCGRKFKRYETQITGKNHFCSRPCRSDYQREGFLGKNNPNYKNGSTTTKSFCECGSEKDRRSNTCKSCYTPMTFLGKTHSKETKSRIGKLSKERFENEDYKKNLRVKNEEAGRWIPLSELDDYKFYYRLCEWEINDSQIDNFHLLLECGRFNPHSKENKNGVVRDHKVSRKTGFDNLIFPEILKHPSNCEFLLNRDNISKGSKSSISINNLFEQIINYKKEYIHQEQCLSLIDKYKSGNRYKREEYQKEFKP